MTHHTKNKGDLGVLKCQVDLHIKGYIICTPLTEHSPFDIVAYKDGIFKRIQVKYRTLSNGCLNIPMKTSWADKNGTHTKEYNKSEIDLFCVYCPDTDTCYYFDPKIVDKSISLRVELPKNNQSKKVNLAKDYINIPS